MCVCGIRTRDYTIIWLFGLLGNPATTTWALVILFHPKLACILFRCGCNKKSIYPILFAESCKPFLALLRDSHIHYLDELEYYRMYFWTKFNCFNHTSHVVVLNILLLQFQITSCQNTLQRHTRRGQRISCPNFWRDKSDEKMTKQNWCKMNIIKCCYCLSKIKSSLRNFQKLKLFLDDVNGAAVEFIWPSHFKQANNYFQNGIFSRFYWCLNPFVRPVFNF